MRAEFDEMFIAFASDTVESPAQRRPDWGIRWDKEDLKDAFWIWYQTNFQVLPFAGGWFDQPKHLRLDLQHCLWGVTYQRQQAKKKGKSELPSFAEKFGVKTKPKGNGNSEHST